MEEKVDNVSKVMRIRTDDKHKEEHTEKGKER